MKLTIERGGWRWQALLVLAAVVALVGLVLPEMLLPFIERQEWTKVVALSVSFGLPYSFGGSVRAPSWCG